MGNNELNTNLNENLKIASPWVNFYREIEALFSRDPEINVVYDEDANVIKLYVDNTDKAMALERLLPTERIFGYVTVHVAVIPANQNEKSKIDLIRTAFKDNPAFKFSRTIDGVLTNPIHYVVFAKEVVQYPLDNLHDLYGNVNTLYQSLAYDVIGEDEGICFCTDIE